MSVFGRRFGAALLVAVILAAISAAGGYRLGLRGQERSASAETQERKPLYWYDPMAPDQHFGQPGKSPFMDMQLIPRFADETTRDGAATVKIDPRIVQNLGIRMTRVERGTLGQPIEAAGTLEFNQRDVAVVQARSSGFVTRVYSRAPGDVVARDAPIVDLLMPQWTAAQAEFLALLKSGDHDLADAARERLLLLGMPRELITAVEKRREPQPTITVRSPLAGVIETLDVREGMTVPTGAALAKINGFATVWLEAAIPEAQGALAHTGKSVEARLTAYAGRVFKGDVIAVLPETNVATRTVRVRIELPNPDGRLRPGMFARVRLDGGDGETSVLFVSSEAIIRTGTRAIVIAAGERGGFTPTQVQVGADVGDKTVILAGLTEGQRVVASGQFLIDSEASLKGVLARLAGDETDGNTADATPGSRP